MFVKTRIRDTGEVWRAASGDGALLAQEHTVGLAGSVSRPAPGTHSEPSARGVGPDLRQPGGRCVPADSVPHRVWRPALVRAGLLGLVEPAGEKFRAEWTDAAGVPGSAMFQRESAAVLHVARNQADGLRFHDLRHSYATWLVDDGVPVNMVQRVLGHERSSTTLDLYTRRTDDPARVLQALDDE